MGVDLTTDDLQGMADKIARGQGVRLYGRYIKEAETQHWVVTWNGRSFRVFYDPRFNCVRTVLDKIGTPRAKRGK